MQSRVQFCFAGQNAGTLNASSGYDPLRNIFRPPPPPWRRERESFLRPSGKRNETGLRASQRNDKSRTDGASLFRLRGSCDPLVKIYTNLRWKLDRVSKKSSEKFHEDGSSTGGRKEVGKQINQLISQFRFGGSVFRRIISKEGGINF